MSRPITESIVHQQSEQGIAHCVFLLFCCHALHFQFAEAVKTSQQSLSLFFFLVSVQTNNYDFVQNADHRPYINWDMNIEHIAQHLDFCFAFFLE